MIRKGNQLRNRLAIFLTLLILLILIGLPAVFVKYQIFTAPTSPSNVFYSTHILGGFSIDTPGRATNAGEDGIQIAFEYSQPPSEQGLLGQKFQSIHMQVIDGAIWGYIYDYECHHTRELKPQLLGAGQYCQSDPDPSLSSTDALLAIIATHLKQVKDNGLIIGYWVLDDWVQWDAGSAKPLLMKIHQLIQRYTPGRPAICGFGGIVGLHQKYGWEDWIADNFSPQGCDAVGLYIYTSTMANTTPITSPDAYNWSMAGVLPAMFSSLQKRGWSIAKEPFIGIGQAFGGPIARTINHWVTPTAKDIEIQSKSFCEHGASGLTFYAWDDSGFSPATQTPMTSSRITLGIRDGIAACKQYWKQHPPIVPTLNAN